MVFLVFKQVEATAFKFFEVWLTMEESGSAFKFFELTRVSCNQIDLFIFREIVVKVCIVDGLLSKVLKINFNVIMSIESEILWYCFC